MNAALLIILLAHGGYWFGGPGGDNTISVRWAAPNLPMPQAVMSWQISYGKVQLAAKDVEMAAGEKAATIAIELPEARVPIEYLWTYQLKAKQTGKLLEEGKRPVHLFPANILAEQARRLKGKSLLVIDEREDVLAGLLKEAKIEATRIPSVGDMQLLHSDIVLVGQGQLGESVAAQEILLAQARRGAGVMIFAQTQPPRLGGWELHDRKLPADDGAGKGFQWRQDHPLFVFFDGSALDGWLKEGPVGGGELKAMALPTDAAVLELGYWLRETPGKEPVPIDALVATQTLGLGRIVYWQIPIASWKADPRVQILLANVLEYLLTRPEPTLPQAQRQPATRTAKPMPEKQLLGGAP